MAGSHAAINPRLICTITGLKSEDVPDKPTVNMLPGQYGQLVARRKNRFRPAYQPNKHYLVCGHCGRKGQYDVGHVVFDLDRWMADRARQQSMNSEAEVELLDYIQTTAYFRCKHCNGAGKWGDTYSLEFGIMVGMLPVRHMEDSQYSAGEIRLFDGSRPRWISDGEEHFLQKLQTDDQDSYLWNRLGNLYYQGGRPDLAAVAWEQSVRVDPKQMESHYSLGNLLLQIGETEKAASHFRTALASARFYEKMEATAMRDMLTGSLQSLFQIHLESHQTIPFLPTEQEQEKAGRGDDHSDERVLTLLDFELYSDDPDSFKPLAEMFMGPRRQEIPDDERTLDKHLSAVGRHLKQKETLQPRDHFSKRARLTGGRIGVTSLGSEQRPVVIDVNSEERAVRIGQVCDRLGLHYVIGFSVIEDLADLKQAMLARLAPEDPYQPCPCGSGSKFRFCCAKKWKSMTADELLSVAEELYDGYLSK
ncbi:tetratricopeptide repeat protein [Effusibacillus pohliae]|uniref:tetratricopeptide repeat protein n=1 Tax=Effusibacillus pohliae TaxID=232270 RepID=UPI000372C686|nr:tetratricopeptide repeat protein [Effusibacillus pohliae]